VCVGGGVKGIIAVVCMLSASVCAGDKAGDVLCLNKVSQLKYENYCSKAGELRVYWHLAETKDRYALMVGAHWLCLQDFYEVLVECIPTKYAELSGDLVALQSACERMIPSWGSVPHTTYIQMIEFFLLSYRDGISMASVEGHKDFK
jgi:hypothetical protein